MTIQKSMPVVIRGLALTWCVFMCLSQTTSSAAGAQDEQQRQRIVVKKKAKARAALFDAGGGRGVIGAVSGDAEYLRSLRRGADLRAAVDFDYGSLGRTLPTATGTRQEKEDDVSKNSGTATLSYVRRMGPATSGAQFLFALDGEVEHKRFREEKMVGGKAVTGDVLNSFSPVAGGRLRYLNSLLVDLTHLRPARGGGDRAWPELTYWLQVRTLTTEMLVSGNTATREGSLDPTAHVELTTFRLVKRTIKKKGGEKERITELLPFLRGRAEGGFIQPIGPAGSVRGNFDVGVTYYFTSKAGIEMRHFEGFFDHNLRDRKEVTSLNLIWELK
jgi:hypothetical protein